MLSPEDEAVLEQLWVELLQLVERPRGDDNFFDLGGDSLLAVEFWTRLEDSGIRLSLESLFQDGRLSALIESATPVGSDADLQ